PSSSSVSHFSISSIKPFRHAFFSFRIFRHSMPKSKAKSPPPEPIRKLGRELFLFNKEHPGILVENVSAQLERFADLFPSRQTRSQSQSTEPYPDTWPSSPLTVQETAYKWLSEARRFIVDKGKATQH
ncbi:MAG: hypothetical protein M1825_005112, partial [Sarcosagium campestre]